MNVWKSHLFGALMTSIYPKVVQSFIIPHLWKLDKHIMTDLYSTYTGHLHLEIGPGPNPHLHNRKTTYVDFMDINQSVLSTIKNNYSHPYFGLHKGSLLNIDDYPDKLYDSVSAMNVLHCIPNANKWPNFMYNTSCVLKDGGILFGCYVNNKNNNVSHVLNKAGIFHNIHDNLDMVHLFSKQYYHTILGNTIGNCDIFVLKKKAFASEQLVCENYDLRLFNTA